MNAGEPCISRNDLENFREAYQAVFVNHHENGSLMARMNNVEEAQIRLEDSINDIKDGIEALPGKLVKWLTIIVLLLGLFEFIAPSLQKAMGITTSHLKTPETTSDASNPNLHWNGR